MTAIAKFGATTAAKHDALVQRLASLSAEFGESLAAKIHEVRRIWGLIPNAPSADEARSALVKIHDIVHTLAGAGKSFGFPRVSTAAAPLDGLFRLVSEQAGRGHAESLSLEEIAQVEMLIQALEDAATAPGEAIDLEDMSAAPTVADTHHRSTYVVVLAGPSEADAAFLRDALEGYGYRAKILQTSNDMPVELSRGERGIVLADVSSGDTHLELLRHNMSLAHLPLILCSSQTGFADRLNAVRHGAAAFIARPFELEQLVERITALEENDYDRPYRVVIAEDDGPLASFYQAALEHAGMETRVIRRPSKLLDTLSGFDPDLILMDLYMPECTGLDLAQIVRQFPAYTTIPILFLSTESRLDLQLRARHLGADDFLPKPLQPGQLISAVTSRANRYRELKKLTDRDSLTGLLNHTNILRNLERELSVASRTESPVSFAMIDIDHFKSVNDTYGHAVGDQVILRVTHLVRNRLRRVDYVGRYGGEEFAVVMPNTDAAAAKEVMDKLREAALELAHESEKGPFRVTFSCGIGTYPALKSVLEITQAADDALYRAKRGGRNQVVIGEV
ncbi:MAG: diguanylate cyclase [Proteobacteria bacterium]|nr:diguanylate cyclase [Pseudomonadota bacterium]